MLAFGAVLLTNPFLACALCAELLPYFHFIVVLQFIALCAVCLACTIWLFNRTGCVPGTDEISLGEMGKLPTEVLAIGVLAMPLLGFALFFTIGIYTLDVAAAVATVGGGVMLECLLALARKWKAGRVIEDSLLAQFWPTLRRGGRFVFGGLRAAFTGDPYLNTHYPAGRAWAYRILWVCGAMVVLVIVSYLILSNQLLGVGSARWFGIGRYTAFAMFAILVVAVGAGYLAWRAYRDARAFDALLAQIDVAAKGERAPVCVPPDSGLYAASQAVAQIGVNLRESVEAQMKSERMKIELITNVSHDLKTPLTSIIGYLDLLEKQELRPETRDYVLILRQKSERLATTVADLFTLAKATSGSEVLHIEPLDLVMAVRQTLGDLSDAIRAAGIPVKTAMPESAIVRADSPKLYRVLQNILDNALHYALAGTRIYLDVTPGDAATHLTLTNTASYEMTFAPEEVLQRFVRGDASRTTEGSGLGLSIAQTFMQNFGGDLSVDVRGDAFIVELTFPNEVNRQNAPAQKINAVYVGDRPEETAPEEDEEVPTQWAERIEMPEPPEETPPEDTAPEKDAPEMVRPEESTPEENAPEATIPTEQAEMAETTESAEPAEPTETAKPEERTKPAEPAEPEPGGLSAEQAG